MREDKPEKRILIVNGPIGLTTYAKIKELVSDGVVVIYQDGGMYSQVTRESLNLREKPEIDIETLRSQLGEYNPKKQFKEPANQNPWYSKFFKQSKKKR